MKTLSDFIGPYLETQSGHATATHTPRYIFSSSHRVRSSLEDLSQSPSPMPLNETETKGYLPHTPSESNILRQSLDFVDASEDFLDDSSSR